jgi:uncharacterized repeat protein (TIGR03803 family)
MLESRITPLVTITSLTTLAAFSGANGALPLSSLTEDSSGNLFGTTEGGGPGPAPGYGTVFEAARGSSTITTLAVFNGTNGALPAGSLVLDSSGNLFGATKFGGTGFTGGVPSGYGTLFKLSKGSSTVTTVANFNGSNGLSPLTGVIADSSGNLFGVAVQGGPANAGVVFEVAAGSNTITDLASFTGPNGGHPESNLILDSSGTLYGTTFDGGPSNAGTVFKVVKGSGTVTTLASFNGSNGANPLVGLVADVGGNLYGTTQAGGTTGFGTLFKLAKGSSTITTLVPYSDATGDRPINLIQDAAGNLFGLATSGSAGGSVFELPKGGSSLTFLASFSAPNGGSPSALLLDSSGRLFGTTQYGGTYNDGTLFEMLSPTPTWTANQSGFVQTFSASGGTGTKTFSVTSGTLPPGMSLSSGGVLSGTPISAGSYPITVTAADMVGGSASQSYTFTINPGAAAIKYLVTIQGGTTFQAGTGFLVSVQAADEFGNPTSNYGGPATATATLSPSTPKSNFPVTLSLDSKGTGLFLANVPLVGSYTISVTGGSFSGMAGPLTILPGPAARLAFGQQPVSTPTGDVLPPVTVQVQDLYDNLVTSDNSDAVKVAVASGPPGVPGFTAGSTTTANVSSGVATFSNLTLTAVGSYTLGVEVPTRYAGPNSTAFNVTPLQVLPGSFTSSPSGFSVGFNAPFLVNSVTPALYGAGFGAPATVTPTVTLTGPTGPVEGSVVLDTVHKTLTFVQTDTASLVNNNTPILPDGTYTAKILASGPQGLQALGAGGGYLDGTGAGTPGYDWTATFTISSGGDAVVWVPPTTDGPGQALNAPGANLTGDGLPVYLTASTSTISKVEVTLNYDPMLLTVSGVKGDGFSLLPASTPGQALLAYNGPALPAGTATPIGYLTASVPSGTAASPMPYKAKDLLHLGSVSLNGGAIPAVTSDALHVVAYVGDCDGDGAYASGDAAKLTHAGLQIDSGFAAYPLVDPVILADTDGAGFVPADAALQINEAGVGVPAANVPSPPIPASVVFRPIGNNVDPALSLGVRDERRGASGNGVVTVAVNIDDAHPEGSTGLVRGHLALIYDPSRFTVSAADVQAGSLLANGSWSVRPIIDQATGQIGIAFSSDTPLESEAGGSLLTIDFHPREVGGRISNPSYNIALVPSAMPDGQFVATELEDAQGSFTLSPARGMMTWLDLVQKPRSLMATQTPGAALMVAGAPVEAAGIGSRVLEPSFDETRSAAAALAEEDASAEAPVFRTSVTAHGALAIVFSSAGQVTLALPSAVFQVAAVPIAAVVPSWQPFADQFSPPLVQAPGHSEPLPLVRDLLDRSLWALPAWESQDGIEEDGNALDRAPFGSFDLGQRYRRGVVEPISRSPVPLEALDQTVLDQAFARTAAEADPVEETK